MTEINKLLSERQSTHGDFTCNAEASQALKRIIDTHYNAPAQLSDVQRESLDAICAKIARIITGDPNHKDSWDDVAGYATLAANRITIKETE